MSPVNFLVVEGYELTVVPSGTVTATVEVIDDRTKVDDSGALQSISFTVTLSTGQTAVGTISPNSENTTGGGTAFVLSNASESVVCKDPAVPPKLPDVPATVSILTPGQGVVYAD